MSSIPRFTPSRPRRSRPAGIGGIGARFANDGPGWRALAAELSKAGVGRVGIEATGGYERGAANHLRQAGFTVLVLQPLQVRAYARKLLIDANTVVSRQIPWTEKSAAA